VAYLQYTSGSTSEPKGVMINHGNILHNVEAISVQTEVGSESVLVGWVPLFHDMGLVGGPLLTLYSGAQLIFFSPLSFLQNPILWLKAMHKYRATHTESPNFGYEFLLRHVDDKALKDLDLSCLRYTLFGGEVMRPRTFERMAERLHCTGFRAESMTNIFGAAEATLFLAGGGVDSPPLLSVDTHSLEYKRRAVPKSPNSSSTTTLIGCGIPPADCDARIVDPSNQRLLPERAVGEIWLSSPSVSRGYWGRSTAQNEAIFRARVANDPQPLRTYLRTGDLGFIDRGALYICGRIKEMMIFNGRNIHPMDIELCVMNAHAAIRQGCVVAFSVEEQEQEKLVVVAEIKRREDTSAVSAAAAINRALSEQHNLTCKAVLLVGSGTLPKTSSGKLQRYRAREEYLNNRLAIVHAQFSDRETVCWVTRNSRAM
jgi:acyl-CoA synthetase (AMP-forming)/AMP-acid ligase II